MGEGIYLSLEDLIDQDTTSCEFYNTLSHNVKNQLADKDITTFSELTSTVRDIKANL